MSAAIIKYKDFEISKITARLKSSQEMAEETVLNIERAAMKQLPHRVNVLRMSVGGMWIYYMICKYEKRDFLRTFSLVPSNQFKA